MTRYALLALAAMATTAAASDLSLGPAAVQKLVSDQLFTQHGRWYLVDDGPCFAYLERPKTRLTDGRLVLNAHLSARLGMNMGGSCAGANLASNVTMSARLAGKGSNLTLEDIRFDRVDDATAKQALDALQQIAPQALPKTVSVDLLEPLKDQPVTAAGIPVAVTQIRILNTETRRDSVKISFELSLTAP